MPRVLGMDLGTTNSVMAVQAGGCRGSGPLAADNQSIGRVILDGLQPAPRGMPQIEVTFDIDANGILNVAARDRGTGQEQRVALAAASRLRREEVERLAREAAAHAAADRGKRAAIEAR